MKRSRTLRLLPLLLAVLVAFPASGQEAGSGAPESDSKEKAPDEKKQEPRLSEGVLARVNGYDIRFDDYTRFLLALYGKTKLRDLIDRILVEQEAQRLEIVVPHAEIAAAVEAQIEQVVTVLYRGDREKFENTYLETQGMTLDEYRDFIAQKKAYELLQDRCIQKLREEKGVSEAKLEELFEKKYGEDGIRHELRHLLVSTRRKPSRGGRPAEAPRTEAQARERASQLLEMVRGGKDFAEVVREHSEDPLTRQAGGSIRRYRKTLYGPEFHSALEKLTPESPLGGPVRSSRGVHLIQLIGRQVTALEKVREELEKEYLESAPSEKERLKFLEELRKKGKIQLAS